MQGGQILRILDPSTGDLGEPSEEMGGGCQELVASDEPTILAKPSLDATVMQDGESDGRLADPASTDESDRGEVFRQTDDLVDQLITSKEASGWRGG